ncbi:MAG: class I SAM-dependent methyltransferase [Gemmatimonadaceae bacterium]|nr:class I SAM-dependent methyltransferase [Gemmatimonadaceae bacterium]
MIANLKSAARQLIIRFFELIGLRMQVRKFRARRAGRTYIDLAEPPAEIFKNIYSTNYWGSAESRSGIGSTLDVTNALRAELKRIFAELNVQTILDAACGDFVWMREMKFQDSTISYTGVDIVPELIAANNERYGGRNIRFEVRNLIEDPLPAADLVICRDCLVHLSNEYAKKALLNIARSGSRYLLTTSFRLTGKNRDIRTGDWRPLNLLLPPFEVGAPVTVFAEQGVEEGFEDSKTLLLLDLEKMRSALSIRAVALARG